MTFCNEKALHMVRSVGVCDSDGDSDSVCNGDSDGDGEAVSPTIVHWRFNVRFNARGCCGVALFNQCGIAV